MANALRKRILCFLSAPAVLAAVVVGLSASAASGSAPASPGLLQNLQSGLAADNAQISAATTTLSGLEHRLGAIQRDLDAKRAELVRTRESLRAARARLAVLQARLARATRALAANLQGSYEGTRPDVVTVILEARGFADLLERLHFLGRIRDQDVRVVTTVREDRRAVIRLATRLGALEAREQAIAADLLARRNQLASVRAAVAARLARARRDRGAKAARLAQVRRRLAALQAQEARLSGAAGTGTPSSVSPGAISRGGGFVFPMPRGAASPPGTWSEDQGVDISAPGRTPLLAVGSGTIVIHGIGGFGPSAPVLHLDDGRYIYYGHAGPGNMVPIGTHVGAGQVIGEVGAGIVGISTGPHLEIGFADGSGSPIGGTSSQMHSLLLAAYG